MSRALTMIRSQVPVAERAGMMARLRRSRDVARAGGVNYWVFADEAEPATWVEFVEAPDADSLRAALRQLESAGVDDTILREVELD